MPPEPFETSDREHLAWLLSLSREERARVDA